MPKPADSAVPATARTGQRDEQAPSSASTPCLLVVDDDYGGDGAPHEEQRYYTSTLEALGVGYDVWAVPDDADGPPSETLALYRGVVWLTGTDFDTTLTAADQAALTGYLDSGGRLFISGQDIGYDLEGAGGGSAFYDDYLHARFVADSTTTRSLVGADWMSGVEVAITGGDGAGNQSYPSQIDTRAGATGVFHYDDQIANWGAVAYADSAYRVVYFAFGFEAISNGADRRETMARVLDFLGSCPRPPLDARALLPLVMAEGR